MRRKTDAREIPPTAGLPLRLGDLRGGQPALAQVLAPYSGCEDALLTCSGTAALVVALRMLAQRSERREVIVPAYTCPLVAIAVAHCGLRLRLCDTQPGHFAMDPDALHAQLGPQTLAVIPAHLGGRPVDLGTVCDMALAAGATVIEDAAQSLGARHADGTPSGLAGDIGLFSLAAGKGLSTYEGGLLVARTPQTREALRETAQRELPVRAGWELRRSLELLGYWALYRPRGLRLAYGAPLRRALRRDDPVGAVGDRFSMRIPLHRLGRWRQAVATRAAARLPAFLEQTRAQAMRRLPRLAAIPGLRVLDDASGAHGTWPFFLLVCETAAMRDAVMRALWTAGLGVSRLFIHALSDYPDLRAILPDDDCPQARDFAARSFTVSNSPWLRDDAFERIVKTLETVTAQRD
ncbi:aminotransferase class I/II-fold pyridoxal phosphate-dependent enzyme [Oleiagrimonas soli]|uniref:Nucleotide sugar aminotransferase n=1 Tax=Oleiagrimonas soli TaxID=1543381 RepID=A0A099CUX3_9GAMM|nr:aminotransferase class I/II-fold pyridoxal phosphate-dependent enzyme [Oleiagrimonas soli]KGI77753.1 nucleotide sugar aminotransferase [Oleiagrimonas soli]MBB6183932.1 dTDP-4-amino-4,6-dideoxygalactose transaminase [Oleiagrimonas soli]